LSRICLFIDGSVNPQLRIGYGAYFILFDKDLLSNSIKPKIYTKKFINTSSTKLELEVLLWALEDKIVQKYPILIYTDCQNILSLESRRVRFESNDYYTRKNKQITNHKLYKEFYKKLDELDCEFTKVKGHKVMCQKDQIDKLFALVDKASRNALRTQ
jgi:ribonuclease HI